MQHLHYSAWDEDDWSRFYASFKRGKDDECWIWEGPLNNKEQGYPIHNVHGDRSFTITPHHVLYDKLIGFPKTRKRPMLHSECGNRRCVNPYHRKLHLVNKRKRKVGAKKKPKGAERSDFCKSGRHDLRRAGARTKHGSCRACKAERQKKYNEATQEKRRKKREDWAKVATEYLERL